MNVINRCYHTYLLFQTFQNDLKLTAGWGGRSCHEDLLIKQPNGTVRWSKSLSPRLFPDVMTATTLSHSRTQWQSLQYLNGLRWIDMVKVDVEVSNNQQSMLQCAGEEEGKVWHVWQFWRLIERIDQLQTQPSKCAQHVFSIFFMRWANVKWKRFHIWKILVHLLCWFCTRWLFLHLGEQAVVVRATWARAHGKKRRSGFWMVVFWRITTKIRRIWHSVEVLISIVVKQQTVGSGFKNVSWNVWFVWNALFLMYIWYVA